MSIRLIEIVLLILFLPQSFLYGDISIDNSVNDIVPINKNDNSVDIEAYFPIPYLEHDILNIKQDMKVYGGLYSFVDPTGRVTTLAHLNPVAIHKGILVGNNLSPTMKQEGSLPFVSITTDKILFNNNAGILANSLHTGIIYEASVNGDNGALEVRHSNDIYLQPNYNKSRGHYKFLNKDIFGTGTVKIQGYLDFDIRELVVTDDLSNIDNYLAISPSNTDTTHLSGATFKVHLSKDTTSSFILKNSRGKILLETNSPEQVKVGGHVNVQGRVKKNGKPIILSGSVIMFCGTQLPTGWAICNGQIVNGFQTPNLQNRFIRGASQPKSRPLLGGGLPHKHMHSPLYIDLNLNHDHKPEYQGGVLSKKTSICTGPIPNTVKHIGNDVFEYYVGWPSTDNGTNRVKQVWSLISNSGYLPAKSGLIHYYPYKRANPIYWRIVGYWFMPLGAHYTLSMNHYHNITSNRKVYIDIPPLINRNRLIFPIGPTGTNTWDIPSTEVVYIVKLPT